MTGVKELGGACETNPLSSDQIVKTNILETNNTVPRVTSKDAPLAGTVITNISADAHIRHDVRSMQRMGPISIRCDNSAAGQASTIGEGRNAEIPHGYSAGERALLLLLGENGE